jgi:5-methylcytosine-specific restriction enzyme subunit McrC
MYAYSKKFDTSEIWLLYPLNNDMKGKNNIYYVADDVLRTYVNVFFVDVAEIEESLQELKARLSKTKTEISLVDV